MPIHAAKHELCLNNKDVETRKCQGTND